MIKLTFEPRPIGLTDALVKELTDLFKQNKKKAVWKRKDIKQALLKMSNNKCCYCECDVVQASNYMQVEHFYHKDKFEDKVLDWENLLPCCQRCNTTKNDHDVVETPLIHPAIDNPQDELSFKLYRLYGKTDLGKETIRKINLNDDDRLVDVRYALGKELIFELEEILDKAERFEKGLYSQKGRLTSHLSKIMKRCIPSTVFSATKATILLHEDSYQQTKAIFIKHNLWAPTFQELEDLAKSCALDLK
ncbi:MULTISPECIES: hypothetical protein [unclassified Aureispira]|uniref:hypothetical protein n=1 Tax=unclassified Aureispira TaxID=2649989 RepID=UPI000696BC63|nr:MULTISPECIES: hypothetical protein [unclassified Aureispira]WMX16909.1 hypothetical protein QP953_11050 [Aureispira sp. CCB-E]